MAVPFFKKEDIELLGQWGHTIYNKTDKSQKTAINQIKETLWEPSKYWADQVCLSIDGLQRGGKADWKESAGHSRFRFKRYTWYKIYLEEYYHKDFFFTVGIDAGAGVNATKDSLVMKLDFQRERPKHLNESQYEYLNQKMKRTPTSPPPFVVCKPDRFTTKFPT